MELNKRERKYISTAVSFGWEIYIEKNKATGYWDDDSILPVKVGALCEKLIEKGILEYILCGFISRIRATTLGRKFKCTAKNCRHGQHIEYEDGGYGDEIKKGKCETCDGLGVIAEAT